MTRECLKKFSEIAGEKVYPHSLLNEEEIKEISKEKEKETIKKEEELKVLYILKRLNNLENIKQDIKNFISQIDNLLKTITFEDFKHKLELIKADLIKKIEEIEEKEIFEKYKNHINYLIENNKIASLKELLKKENLPENLKKEINSFLETLQEKKDDFISEIQKIVNYKKIQSLIGGKNYKLNDEEINALIEKIKEIYPTLKSKDKKTFFKKVKISKISQQLEEKIKEILEIK